MIIKPKISIVVPMYNVEQYIMRCLNSIYDQGWQLEEFEIIVINDGSTDRSLGLANAMASSYSNMIVLSQSNQGLGAARNTGIRNSSGHYVTFLDSDDWFVSEKLKEIVEIAIEKNIDIIEYGAQGIGVSGDVVYSSSVSTNEEIFSGIEYYQRFRYMNSACNKLYNQAFLINHGLLFKSSIYIEDYEFNTRAYYYASRVMAHPSVVVFFLQSPESITRGGDMKKRIKMRQDILTVIRAIYHFQLSHEGASSSVTEQVVLGYFRQRLSYLSATLFWQLIKDRDFTAFWTIMSQMGEEKLLFVDYAIFEWEKNTFRVLVLKPLAKLIGILNNQRITR